MIVLVGFMGAGKTTVGRLAAERLGLPFIDTDELIEQRHGPIRRIFAERGEAAFREIEARVIAECLAGPDAVVALGGGAVETPAVCDALQGHQVVWLRIGFDAALARVGGDPRRPVLADAGLRARFGLRQRRYAMVAKMTIDAVGSPKAVVERLFEPPRRRRAPLARRYRVRAFGQRREPPKQRAR